MDVKKHFWPVRPSALQRSFTSFVGPGICYTYLAKFGEERIKPGAYIVMRSGTLLFYLKCLAAAVLMAVVAASLIKRLCAVREGHAEEHPPFTSTTGCNQASTMVNQAHIEVLQEKVAKLEEMSSKVDQIAAGEEGNRSSINALLKKMTTLSPVSALKGPGLTANIPGVTSGAVGGTAARAAASLGRLSPLSALKGHGAGAISHMTGDARGGASRVTGDAEGAAARATGDIHGMGSRVEGATSRVTGLGRRAGGVASSAAGLAEKGAGGVSSAVGTMKAMNPF